MKPEQVPETLTDVFRACADMAELLSRQETREGLAAVLSLWEQDRPAGELVRGCLWETIGTERGTHDRLAMITAGTGLDQYTLVLQRCAGCLSLRVQSLPGHWSNTQLGVQAPPGGECSVCAPPGNPPQVPPPRPA